MARATRGKVGITDHVKPKGLTDEMWEASKKAGKAAAAKKKAPAKKKAAPKKRAAPKKKASVKKATRTRSTIKKAAAKSKASGSLMAQQAGKNYGPQQPGKGTHPPKPTKAQMSRAKASTAGRKAGEKVAKTVKSVKNANKAAKTRMASGTKRVAADAKNVVRKGLASKAGRGAAARLAGRAIPVVGAGVAGYEAGKALGGSKLGKKIGTTISKGTTGVKLQKAEAKRRNDVAKKVKAIKAEQAKSKTSKTKPTKTTAKPVAKKQAFGDAFKAARGAGKKVFTWNGKKYHTRTKEEEAKRKSVRKPTSKPSSGGSVKKSDVVKTAPHAKQHKGATMSSGMAAAYKRGAKTKSASTKERKTGPRGK